MKFSRIGILILVITLMVMGVNHFFVTLPDWVVRADGITMLIGVCMFSYGFIRHHIKYNMRNDE